MTSTLKKCNICHRLLPLSEYYKKKGHHQWACINCLREYGRENARVKRKTDPVYVKKQKEHQRRVSRSKKAERQADRKWRRDRMKQMIADLRSMGMTQAELGRMLGCTQATVSAWALGKRAPEFDNVMKVTKAWKVLRLERGLDKPKQRKMYHE